MRLKPTTVWTLSLAVIVLLLSICLLLFKEQEHRSDVHAEEVGSISIGVVRDTVFSESQTAANAPSDLIESKAIEPERTAKSSAFASRASELNSDVETMPLPPILSVAPAGYQPEVLTQYSQLTEEHIADAVAIITGKKLASTRDRFQALSLLRGKPLPESAKTTLLDFLSDTNRHQAMSAPAMYVFVNELVRVFHDSHDLDDRYLEASVAVIDNVSEAEVIRDYTLQGLSRAYPNATEDQAEFIREAAWDSLNRTDTSLPGTALLALNRIHAAGELSDAEVQEFQEAVISAVSSPNIDERTRISAIQVAAELQRKDLIPALLGIVNHHTLFQTEGARKPTPSEKLTALAALKSLGFSSIEQLYHEAAQSRHPLLEQAAARVITQSLSSP